MTKKEAINSAVDSLAIIGPHATSKGSGWRLKRQCNTEVMARKLAGQNDEIHQRCRSSKTGWKRIPKKA